MTTNNLGDDRITRAIASLPVRALDRQRADAIRARCHAALRQPSRQGRLGHLVARLSWTTALEPATVGLVSAIYLSEVVRRAWLLYF